MERLLNGAGRFRRTAELFSSWLQFDTIAASNALIGAGLGYLRTSFFTLRAGEGRR